MPPKKKRARPSKSTVAAPADPWDTLERRVQTYYEALGYKVTRNVALDHHQLDMIASKYIEGGLVMTLMIECKHRSGTVGIDEVTTFRNTATHLIHAQRINSAVMITNSQYSKEANGLAADSATIRLLTLNQLEQDVFNSTGALLRVARDYASQDIHREFIPLKALDTQERCVDALKFISHWARPGAPLLLVVGDFGSGKTTLMDRAHYDFAQARLDNGDGLFPVLLRLRAFRRYPDLWSFVEASLRDNQYVHAARRVFEAELQAGRLILFIDGFDEIHTGASAKDRGRYLSQLAPLLSTRSPCVISTRPTYFESFDVMVRSFRSTLDRAPALDRVSAQGINLDRLLSQLDLHEDLSLPKEALMNTLRVQSLDAQQILTRLKKDEAALTQVTQMSIKEFRDFLLGIYDIEDLMKRPLLLKMIIETALSADVDFVSDKTKHGPASLYDLYTQMCAIRDVKRAPESQYLTRASRLDASRQIALAMFRLGRVQLQAAEVRKAVQATRLQTIDSMNASSDVDHLERALTDVRLCSFLKFDADGTLAFTHKSYLEFFVAQHGYLQSKQSIEHLKRFANAALKREHLYFLGSFARDQADFGELLKLQLPHADDKTYRTFLLRTLFASGSLLHRTKLEHGDVFTVDVRRVTLHGTTLRHLNLENVTVSQVAASQWEVDFVNLISSEIQDCTFSDSRINFGGAIYSIISVTTVHSDWRFGGNRFTVSNFQARGSVVTLDGEGRYANVMIDESSTVVIGSSCHLDGTTFTISDSTVIGLSNRSWLAEDARVVMKDCRLSAVHVSLADLLSDRLSLINCSGAVILQTELYDKLDSSSKARLHLDFPLIEFVDEHTLQRELDSLGQKSPDEARALLSRPSDASLNEFKGLSSLVCAIQEQQTASHFGDSYLSRYLS